MLKGLRPHLWRLLVLGALVFAAYSNSFQAGLVFDSQPIIAKDSRIRAATAENLGLIFKEDYWYRSAPSGLYRPLTTLSYLANYAMLRNEANPAGYHWVNLLVHMANVWLVYALALMVLDDWRLALSMAALWGIHPILTEAVTNIVGRADLLATFGILTGLILYIRRPKGWMAGLVAAQTIGLFSKETAIVLPALLLAYDLTLGKRRAWPAYGLLAIPILAFLYLRAGIGSRMAIQFLENPLVAADFWTARLTALEMLAKLNWLFFWPAHLSPDYSYRAVPLAGAAVLTGRSQLPPKPLIFLGLIWAIGTIPTSNIPFLIGSIGAERFLYLPSIGLAGCVVWAVSKLRWRKAALAGLGIICLALAARTYARNLDWHDEVSLWSSAIQVVPNAARPHNNLCVATDDARECEEAIRILPDYADAHYNLGRLLVRRTEALPRAVAEFGEALRIEPGFAAARKGLADANFNLATYHAQGGRLEAAVTGYQAALQADPNFVEAHANLAVVLSRMPGRRAEAIQEMQTAVRLRPDPALQAWLERLQK